MNKSKFGNKLFAIKLSLFLASPPVQVPYTHSIAESTSKFIIYCSVFLELNIVLEMKKFIKGLKQYSKLWSTGQKEA